MSSIRCIQVNLHHAKGASSVLSRRFTKEQLGVALIQEPWVNHNKILGLTSQNSKLIYCSSQTKPRTAILLGRDIKYSLITEFIQRDIVAVTVTVRNLSSNDVNVCNKGNEPTFVTVARQEVLDLTLCSSAFADKIKDWHVSNEASLSDHRQIVFRIEANQLKRETYRNPSDTDWEAFKRHLKQSKTNAEPRIRTAVDLDNAADTLQCRITAAYHASCKKIQRETCRDVPWWSENLSTLRKEARRLFNRAKLTSNWEPYKKALTKYNAELRKAKRKSMANFCEDISSMSEATRLQKALSKDHSNGLGQVRNEQGILTTTNRETLQVLMSTHFPDSTERNEERQAGNDDNEVRRRSPSGSVELARQMFNQSSIKWALGSFEPLKAAGPDGILPIFLQKTAETIMAELINLFRASFSLGYIPRNWRKVKVIFIPKAGKSDPTMPKAFRPISLTSTLLKLMEKITDNYIRTEFLKDSPLHKHQYAYQAGKSTETALHTLVTLIEKTLKYKETALSAFLDIQGAFDNTTYTAIDAALRGRNVDETTTNWIREMLTCREITASLGDTSITITAAKGCPQGGVLSPLLWSLVVDSLLKKLTLLGYDVIGYADDVALIVRGKFDETLSSRLQSALNYIMQWCEQEGLNINPAKTVIIPFTNRRKHDLRPPTLKGTQLTFSTEVKYLGVILDNKLNWNSHLDYAVKKATTAIWACNRLFGKTLNPNWLSGLTSL